MVLLVYLGVQGGFLAGLLGVGGGAIAIAVFAAIGVDQVLAQGIAITATIPTVVVGALQHGRQGTLAPRQGLLAGLVGMLFAIPGALIAFAVPVEVLRTGFGVFLLLGSYRMFRALRRPRVPRSWRNRAQNAGVSLVDQRSTRSPTMSDATHERRPSCSRPPRAACSTGSPSALPARVMPDHMTVLGVLAALGIGAAYWLSGRDPAWLWVASGLLVVHWLGDSLDGTLARVRRIERPKYGYYLDHLVDAGATIAIGAGLGLSPYMGLATGLAVVIAYLALSINTYLETQVFGVFSLGYGRFGPTEARVGLIALNLALLAGATGVLDIAGLAIAGLMLVGLGVRAARNLRVLAEREPAGVVRT